ncbi:HpcH/HpaI aldolase/citrate lyase family protein [Qingshengfaniella alkalisoli]|uniref:CoA ester lyase n=1 Tax=Qingshengfaniella alkalisoli TaxID=2599296 RepID=A0A5B8JAS4_9RHOB|nr:CoA ester lyase [Qingshengfaniella alkalisoli]QDY71387.1 CoA ester lyase [Qingshengfaniella alkalisoli]
MTTPRSYLFVPGRMPDRFAKAAGSGADAIILDLEDAVGPDSKSEARDHVAQWFGSGGTGLVRINGAETPWFDDDLAALSSCDVSAVMVPKATPESLSAVAEKLPGRALVALIETAEGLAALRRSVTCPGVTRLAFGNLDFGADTRIPGTGPVLDPVRFEIVLASRLGGLVSPVDGVTPELKDAGILADEVARSRMRGFGAKLCIHPAQVAFTNDGFTPSEAEVDWASRVLSALSTASGSVVQVDGKMVDRPVIERARQVLADAGQAPRGYR